MSKSKLVLAVALLFASSMVRAPAKTEQPATAAGGQSSSTVASGKERIPGSVAIVAGAIAAVAVTVNRPKDAAR
jgi:lipopolysaccharide export system protein LptA